MNNDNIFDLLVAVVFSISPQLGGIESNSKFRVASFQLIGGELLPEFHLQDLQ